VSSQNAHLLKFFLPLPPALLQFEQTFFILCTSAAAPAAFAAFFTFFPSYLLRTMLCALSCLLSLHSHRESTAKADNFLPKVDTAQ